MLGGRSARRLHHRRPGQRPGQSGPRGSRAPRECALVRCEPGRKMSLLEVITQTEADAEAAEDGGADRIEVVADVRAGGLSPAPRTVAGMRRVTSRPMRVMLRAKTGFRTTGPELERLRRAAVQHAEAGADGF